MVREIQSDNIFPWTYKVNKVPEDCGSSFEMFYNCEKSPVLLFREAMKTIILNEF